MMHLMQERWRTMSLRSRLRLMVTLAVTMVVGITTTYLMVRQRSSMLSEMDVRGRMMEEDLGRDMTAVARTIALASQRALLMHDFLFLAQINELALADNPQVKYSALIRADGVAVIHTDQALAGKTIDNPLDKHFAEDDRPVVHNTAYQGQPILEAVVPLHVGEKIWGTVRIGTSLTALHKSIEEQRTTIDHLIREGLISSFLVTLLLIAGGVAFGSKMADALVQPLGKLMEGALELQAGKFSSTVIVKGSPEFVDLARTFNDMTLAVRRREEALQTALTAADEASRLKSTILSNVSHELRTPLNAIINVPGRLLEDFETYTLWRCDSCSMSFEQEADARPQSTVENCPQCGSAMYLKEETFFTGSPADHKRLNRRAFTSSQHLLSLINDLLDFSKLQAGKMTLNIDSLNPGVLAAEVSQTAQSLVDNKSIKLEFDIDPDLGFVEMDKLKTNQVLINLLSNAIKFTPEGGRVKLGMYPSYHGDLDKVHFLVSDSGIGIPEDKLKSIFEPFRQVDGSHTRSYGGTGLGLAITAQIVEMHQGQVWAESQLGKGSRFHVVLPRHHEVEAQPEQPSTQLRLAGDFHGRAQRVLIVDDDATYCELARHMLETTGMHVDTMLDPGMAFQQILSTMPDLIIIDVLMPQVNGVELLRRLKSSNETQSIPVVVSTGMLSYKDQLTQLGGLWLPKPWDAAKLAECLITNSIVVAMPIQKDEQLNSAGVRK